MIINFTSLRKESFDSSSRLSSFRISYYSNSKLTVIVYIQLYRYMLSFISFCYDQDKWSLPQMESYYRFFLPFVFDSYIQDKVRYLKKTLSIFRMNNFTLAVVQENFCEPNIFHIFNKINSYYILRKRFFSYKLFLPSFISFFFHFTFVFVVYLT